MRHQSLSFISFGWAWVRGESWRTGGKSSGNNMPKNPLHSPPENLLNIWLVLTVSLVWSLAQRRERKEEPPLACVTATGAQQIAPLGHAEERPLQSPSVVPPAAHLFTGGSRKQEMRNCKGIKKHFPPARTARTSYVNWRSPGIWDWAARAFRCPGFQHHGPSPALDFLHVPPLPPELRWVGLQLCLASSTRRLFQPGYIRVTAP